MNQPSLRKPLGILFILGLISVWASLVLLALPWISSLPGAAQAIVYAVAGVVWILPLGRLLRWMEGEG